MLTHQVPQTSCQLHYSCCFPCFPSLGYPNAGFVKAVAHGGCSSEKSAGMWRSSASLAAAAAITAVALGPPTKQRTGDAATITAVIATRELVVGGPAVP